MTSQAGSFPRVPRVGIAVALVRNKEVLIGKRKNSHGAGSWAFPGGHLEFGETWEGCAARELLEETGIETKKFTFGGVVNDIMKENHYITIVMNANAPSDAQPQLMEPHKCEEWIWVPWEELPTPLFSSLQLLINSGFNPIN